MCAKTEPAAAVSSPIVASSSTLTHRRRAACTSGACPVVRSSRLPFPGRSNDGSSSKRTALLHASRTSVFVFTQADSDVCVLLLLSGGVGVCSFWEPPPLFSVPAVEGREASLLRSGLASRVVFRGPGRRLLLSMKAPSDARPPAAPACVGPRCSGLDIVVFDNESCSLPVGWVSRRVDREKLFVRASRDALLLVRGRGSSGQR